MAQFRLHVHKHFLNYYSFHAISLIVSTLVKPVFFQFEIIINDLVSFLRFIRILLLRQYKHFTYFTVGTVFIRQNLSVPTLIGLIDCR